MKNIKKQTKLSINLLREKGIRLLAIDFDNTLISLHTSGLWKGKSKDLAQNIRPHLAKLIESCLDSEDIYVAIVTFSPQKDLIANVMKQIFKNFSDLYIQTAFTKSDLVNRLPGKENHIYSVINNIQKDHGIAIKAEEVFLVDDDPNNINTALKYNHRAFLFESNTTLGSLNFYLNRLIPSNYPFLNIPLSPYSSRNLSPKSNLSQNDLMPQNWFNPQQVNNSSTSQHSTHSLPSAAYQAHQSLFPVPWFWSSPLPSCSYYMQN